MDHLIQKIEAADLTAFEQLFAAHARTSLALQKTDFAELDLKSDLAGTEEFVIADEHPSTSDDDWQMAESGYRTAKILPGQAPAGAFPRRQSRSKGAFFGGMVVGAVLTICIGWAITNQQHLLKRFFPTAGASVLAVGEPIINAQLPQVPALRAIAMIFNLADTEVRRGRHSRRQPDHTIEKPLPIKAKIRTKKKVIPKKPASTMRDLLKKMDGNKNPGQQPVYRD